MTLIKSWAKLKVKVFLITVLKFYFLGLCDVGTWLVTQGWPCTAINHTLFHLLKIDFPSLHPGRSWTSRKLHPQQHSPGIFDFRVGLMLPSLTTQLLQDWGEFGHPQVARAGEGLTQVTHLQSEPGDSARARSGGSELCPQSQCPFSSLGQTEIGLKAHSPSGLISLPSHNVLFPPQHQGICFILGFKSLQPLLKDKGAQHLTVIFFLS